MYPLKQLLYLTGLFLLIIACEPDNSYDLPAPNNELLFPETQSLNITQQVAEDLGIFFSLQDDAAALLYVGIFSEPPLVIAGELVNPEATLWEWLGEKEPAERLYLTDGNYQNATPPLDLAYFQCNTDPVYWGAWAWDETAQYITHATPKDLVVNPQTSLPDVRLLSATQVTTVLNDTLVIPGEQITLRLEWLNAGDEMAEAMTLAVEQVDVAEFPLQLSLPDLAPGETVTRDIQFTVPPSLTYNDTVNLNYELVYNGCLTTTATAPLRVNGLNVCLNDVQLLRILYVPSTIFWDPLALPTNFNADAYYQFFTEDSVLLTSSTIENISDDWTSTPVLADWEDFVPCYPLDLTSTYQLRFWDSDILLGGEDDYIGAVNLRMVEHLATQPDTLTIMNEEVMIAVLLEWQ